VRAGLVLGLFAVGCGARSSLLDGGSEGGAGGEAPQCVISAESCNGQDDDCNGQIDDGVLFGDETCSTGLPANCAAGKRTCAAGEELCQAINTSLESCNGLDDDCNGIVDDADPDQGSCETGALGACGAGTLQCISGALACIPDVTPSPEVCNGADDDCNGVDDEPPVCTRRVFVSSILFTGNLGGLEGADAECQALADSVALGGSFKAWLSSSIAWPENRFTQLGAPYVLLDGTVIADSWQDLTDQFLQHPINLSEQLGPAPVGTLTIGGPEPGQLSPVVFTNTAFDGVYANRQQRPPGAYSTCDDWSNDRGPAGLGATEYTNGAWTNAGGSPFGCELGAALYCFEQ